MCTRKGEPQEFDTTLENRLKWCWRIDIKKRELKWSQYSCVVDEAWNARMKHLIYKRLVIFSWTTDYLRKNKVLQYFHGAGFFTNKFGVKISCQHWSWSRKKHQGFCCISQNCQKLYQYLHHFIRLLSWILWKELPLIKLLWCLVIPWKIFEVIQKKFTF